MSEEIYTQKRTNQYGGNYSSADYNKRVEENYQDLVSLYNKYNIIDSKIESSFNRIITDHIFLAQAVKDASDRLKALEANEKMITLHSFSQIDNTRFSGTELAIGASEQLSFNSIYNFVTLPLISGPSISIMKTYNTLGEQVIPNYINLRVSPINSLDNPGVKIDTTPPYYSLYDRADRVWKRSIISDTQSDVGALMYLYIKVPNDSSNLKINNLRFSSYPVNSVDILSVEYTQSVNPSLTSGDSWRALNFNGLYNNDPDAVGYVAPGGWSNNQVSDAIINSGPLYFNCTITKTDDKPITGFRIQMRQRNYIKENGKFVYTYGLSDLDIRADKYMPQGKMFIKFVAPKDTLIFNVTGVTPKIYNVPLSLTQLAFSSKVYYPTAGGGYSQTPQGGSALIWLEITMNELDDGTIPILSDIIIKYS
jgi:hypothetical protein